MYQFTKQSKPLIPTFPINNVSLEVNITEDFRGLVDYLCKQVPHKEWSGILFYTIDGDFEKDTSITIIPEYVHLMDIGTAGYTEYDWDATALKLTFDKPELMGLKLGHIHSHNNMTTFFSGTDLAELSDNAPHYNQYFSLIVNNKLEMTAKLAVMGKIESTQEFSFNTRLKGLFKTAPKQELKDALFTLDAKFKEQEITFKHDSHIKKRFAEVQEENKKRTTTTMTSQTGRLVSPYTDNGVYEEYDPQLSFPYSARKDAQHTTNNSLDKYNNATLFYEADSILISIITLLDPSLRGISHMWGDDEAVAAYKAVIDISSYNGQPHYTLTQTISECLDEDNLKVEFTSTYEDVDEDYSSSFRKFLIDMINILKVDSNPSNVIIKAAIRRLEEIINNLIYSQYGEKE